ncbi:hypothetical protein DB31_5769 [Hyalangium minutum]|uniref:HYR domain-containing protein n=1 Tax=Hyalangium minutum TaxID=394096 RepID=A0A085WSR4_9BACT|nr:hypothetical protein DB31_5769 [Hyalangium minutum]
MRVSSEGLVQFTPHHVRTEQEPPILSEPLKVKTASISRGPQPLLQAARASVREDGALTLARGPVVEVLQNGDEGLEQRWELAAKPAGTGDLEVRVELAGLDYVSETALGHHYVDRKTGLGVRYGKATWVDAAGVKTPVDSVREGRALVIRVPARVLERSAFPAVLDPIISPEISPDTPVPAPNNTDESSPAIAAGGGLYFVAWTVTTSSSNLDVLGTRVRASDGAVLDVNGISLGVGSAHQLNPAVASNGSDFLVVWDDSSDIRAARVRGSTGQILGSTFYVSTAASSQGQPAVAFDGTNYLVVWDDYRNGSHFDVYGSRVRASDGVVLDPSGLPISTAAGWQTAPSVHFDGTQYLVAWSDTRGSSEADLYGTRVSVAGTPLDPAGILISSAPGYQFSPSIASAGGLFFLAWDDRRNEAQSDVYAARLRASDGVVLDPAGIPLATGPASQTGVSAASDGSRFLVVWHHSTDSNSSDVYGQRIGMDGGLIDPAAVPLFAATTRQERVPTVVFDGTRFMVVWVNTWNGFSRGDIHGGRVQPSDLAVIDTPPLLVSSTANSEGAPAVAAGANSYLVVWMDSRGWTGGFGIHGVRIRASDGVVLDPVAIRISPAIAGASNPSVAFDGSHFLVVWNDYRGAGPATAHVYGARVREADGAVLDTEGIAIANTSQRTQSQPKVAFGEGIYLVTWTDNNVSGTAADVYAARVRASDGGVLDPTGIAVATAAHNESGPATAYGGGTFLVAWSDTRNGFLESDIYAARVRASDGVILDSPGFPLNTRTGAQSSVALAFDGSLFLAVWKDERTSNAALYGTRVRPSDGTVLDTGGGRVLYPDSSYKGAPALAFDGSSYLLVWRDSVGLTFRLNGGRLAPDLTQLDASRFLISDMSGQVSSTTTPAAAAWGRGRFLAAYEPYDTVAVQLRVKVRLVSDPVNGSRCMSGTDCTSGFCVDGVCCATACTGGTCSGGTCEYPAARLICPANMVAEATSATGALVNYPPAMATGTAPLTVTYSQASGTRFAMGTTPVNANLVDGEGRTASCSFSVTVRDSTAPALSCSGDLVAEATGPSGATVSFPAPTATDAVTAAPTVTVSHVSGSTFPLGVTSVTATSADAAGNTSTCTFTLTVRDTTPPLLSCPGNLTVDATSTMGANVTYPPATATDLVSIVTPGYSKASGSHFDVGSTPVSVTATDGAGNSASCTFTITVRLPPAPQLTCPADVVAEATSASGALAGYPPATATGSEPLTVTYSQASGTQFSLGATSVTATVTDSLSRTHSCSFTVTVRDTTAPSVSCPGDLIAEATGPSGAAVSYLPPTTTDAVTSAPTVSVSHASGSTFPLGSTRVTATAADAAGNTSTCAFTLTVRDTSGPTLSCPGNLTVDATSTTGANATYPPATATDSVSSVTLSYSKASGSHFDVGSTPVSVTATDGAGNSASCTFTITVRLPPAPQLTCPANGVAEATSASGALVTYPPATATGSEPLTVTYSQASGTGFALGATSITATVTDGLGRTHSCSFSVTVRDTTAPSLSCPQDLVAEATGPNGAAVSYLPPTATDAVTSAPTVSVSHASGSTFPLGSTRVSATATDAAGNASTCAFTLTVRDTSEPTLSCPASVTAEATSAQGAAVTYPPATASDTSSSPTLHYSQVSGTRFSLGTTAVTVTATDGAGNTSSCTFTVIVRDTTPPALACGADLVAEATARSGASVNFSLPTATDAVTATPVLTASHASRSLFPLGATRVTVTASDEAGNTRTCAFTITVRDTTAPEVGCPGPLTAEAEDATGAPVAFSVPAPRDTVTSSPTVTASHSPGSRFPLGTTPVLLSASDEAGNTASCTFSVTVRDTIVPQLTCPTHVQVMDAPPEGMAVNYPPATTWDAVSSPVLSYSQASGTVFPVGRTSVTVTATDAAGNSASCAFEVRVAPSIQEPPEPPPSEGCGCGAGSSTSAGFSWGALMLLAWGVTRRRLPC